MLFSRAQNPAPPKIKMPSFRGAEAPLFHVFQIAVLQIAVGQVAAVAVAIQPIIQKCLVEVRRDDFFSEFVRLGADERDVQASEDGDQRLRDAVGIRAAVGIFGFDLGKRRGDDEQAVRAMSRSDRGRAVRSRSERWF
jgi:hypothetical protein